MRTDLQSPLGSRTKADRLKLMECPSQSPDLKLMVTVQQPVPMFLDLTLLDMINGWKSVDILRFFSEEETLL